MSFPAYPACKNSGVEWLGEVPVAWTAQPVKAIATFNDETLPDNTDPDFEFSYIEISDVSATTGIGQLSQTTFQAAPSRARRVVRPGDTIISTVRTYLRAIAPIPAYAETLIASTGFCVIRPQKGLGSYLGYALLSDEFIQTVISRSVGVSYPAINASELVSIKIAVPPLDEQRAIAAFLDRETARIDAAVAAQERLIALLAEKRAATISHAVTKGLDPNAPMKDSGIEWLGQISAHWGTSRIANLFVEVSDPSDNERPVLSVSIHNGVSDQEIDEDDRPRMIVRSEDRSKYKAVEAGDLVYNMMRAWQGAFGSVSVRGAVSPAYIVARPASAAWSQYANLLLRTPQAVTEIKRYSRGVTDFRLRLYWDEFKNLVLPTPPEAEIEQFLKFVQDEEARVESLATKMARGITLLKERRAALISAAVTGKIDVRGEVPAAAQEAA